MEYRYVFGPVVSRRLGMSLGVDLVPPKTCSLDCIYCECGPTNRLTISRKEYVPVEEVCREVDQRLETIDGLDWVTFSGAGEPTLHSGLGRVARHIKKSHPGIQTAILTNGTLLDQPEVVEDCLLLDMVKISLDAATPGAFEAVNRPHPKLSLETMIQSMAGFREIYTGHLAAEVFLARDQNDREEELEAIGRALKLIRPDSVQVNTLDRPGTEPWVEAARKRTMKTAARLFGGLVIGKPRASVKGPVREKGVRALILSTIRRRPCTARDVASSLGLDSADVERRLEKLMSSGAVTAQDSPRGVFYTAKDRNGPAAENSGG